MSLSPTSPSGTCGSSRRSVRRWRNSSTRSRKSGVHDAPRGPARNGPDPVVGLHGLNGRARLTMSDHVDGPRSIGEPAADVTDLFAFTSPENPGRTVLAMCVFPSAGEDAMFSNAIDHAIVVRRVAVAGVGLAAKFQPADDEIRFSVRFGALQRDAAGHVSQTGVCTLPGGRTLSLTVNDEKGASTPEGDVRVFAGLRSDPFYLAWIAATLEKV